MNYDDSTGDWADVNVLNNQEDGTIVDGANEDVDLTSKENYGYYGNGNTELNVFVKDKDGNNVNEGSVTFVNVFGKNYTADVNDGLATKYVFVRDTGEFNITCNYIGTGTYNNASTTLLLNVPVADTLCNNIVATKYDDTVYFSGNVVSDYKPYQAYGDFDDTEEVTEGNVTVYVDGERLGTCSVDVNGNFVFIWKTTRNLIAETINFTGFFTNNQNHFKPSKFSKNFTFESPKASEISASVEVIDGDFLIRGSVKDESGNAVVGGKITIDDNHSVPVDANGNFIFRITNKTIIASNYEIGVMDWGSKADITVNQPLMNGIEHPELTDKLIDLCKQGTPYVKFGNGNGKTIVVDSGIHGGELPSQAAAFKLIDVLANYGGDINGTIYIFPVLFPQATANNTRIFNETNLNKVANVNGSISNELVKFAKSVGASGLGDFHCTRHSDSDVGITCTMCTYEPTFESYLIASYIANETGYDIEKYDVAGVPYAGAVEDCSNLFGVPAITSETLSNHRAIEYGSTEISFNMMAAFLRYFGFDINQMMKVPLTANNLTLTFTSPYNYNSSHKSIDLSQKHYGYWVRGADMKNLNLTDLSSHGVTDILLNYRSYAIYNQSEIESFISSANENGIRVHIWVLIFWHDGWTRPVKNGEPNQEFFDQEIEEIKKYANTAGLSGIHYDYLRFSGSVAYNNSAKQNPGGMEAISEFVRQSTKAIRELNPNLTISAAIMPEIDYLEDWYGDDYSVLSKELDVIIPMVYTAKFNKDSQWIKQTTQWFVENSQGAEIWTGLQGYTFADYDEEVISNTPTSQISIDIKSALEADASGVMLFRFGVCNNIDFTNLSVDESELSSLSYLNYLVSTAKKPIVLTKDIQFNEKYDGNFTNGIVILKNNLVIDGANHIVDAKGMARIFNISGRNITLKNFKFINAYADKGAAIYASGNDTKIINCTFINGSAGVEAGAIFLRAPRGQVINSTFVNSSAYYTGAVLINSVNASVIGCHFEDNRANVSAGALGWATKDNGIIKNCIFVNNSAYNEGGGAIFWNQGKNGIIENVSFINNYANFNGSAIFWSFGENGQIINSIFINNNARISGGAIYLKGNNNVIYNSTFVNNTAKFGGAINTINDLDVLKCSFENNDIFAGSGVTVNVISNPESIRIVGKTATYNINYGGNYSVTLRDSSGNPINGKKLTVTLNGKGIGSATTNAKGVATIKITSKALKTAKSGKKNLVVKFSSPYYASVSKTVKVTINKEKTKLTAGSKAFKRTVKTKKYQITLKNSKNKAMKNKKVTLKVKGKTYKASTNSKGKATFKITKLTNNGTFKAKVKYAGNAYYKSVSKSVKIKIR